MGNCPVSLNLHRRGAGHKRIHDRNVRVGRRVVSVENGVYTNRKAISVRPLVRQPPTTSLHYKKGRNLEVFQWNNDANRILC
ncbi:hypothetical protein NPIL_235761 [Nephila pilipes]|uniref:Uncharacterized protein n=1 Tax=Nephila pilipes TaxID=299642 RepID=A0A8X6IZI3_NEPPI|nr:hypothetical protein NPIL_235761 [Nephila pilipes]